MTQPVPLFGTLGSLDELFKAFIFAPPNYSESFYPLLGLPGSIDTRAREYLHVLPQDDVLAEARRYCCNRHLGGFRSSHSDHWTNQQMLPIYAYDFVKVSSTLLALVPIWELSRFTHSLRGMQADQMLLSSSIYRQPPSSRPLRMNDDPNALARPA